MAYQTAQPGGMAGQQSFPVDNLTYDLLTCLQSKLESIEVYQRYMEDAQGEQECVQLLRQMMQQDWQQAEQLKQVLLHRLGQAAVAGQPAGARP